MFTGLIQQTGIITAIKAMPNALGLTIRSELSDLNLGESIAIDGVCLTVIQSDYPQFQVELSSETLAKTIASRYQINDTVNLERALQIGDRLGGHFVTGHVDQTALVKKFTAVDNFYQLEIEAIQQPKYLVEKGSITVNGVSLTLNTIHNDRCEFMLIPHTLSTTNLKALKSRDKVNIEFDLLAKIVAQQTHQGVDHAN